VPAGTAVALGEGLGEGVGLGLGRGVGVGEGVGLGEGDGVGEGVGLGVAFGVAVTAGDGVATVVAAAVPPPATVSPSRSVASAPPGLRTVTSYEPAARLAGASVVKTDPFTHVVATVWPPTTTLALRAKLLPSTIRNAACPGATLAGSTWLTAGGPAAFAEQPAPMVSTQAAIRLERAGNRGS